MKLQKKYFPASFYELCCKHRIKASGAINNINQMAYNETLRLLTGCLCASARFFLFWSVQKRVGISKPGALGGRSGFEELMDSANLQNKPADTNSEERAHWNQLLQAPRRPFY